MIHTHTCSYTQFGFPFGLAFIPCKEYFVLRAVTAATTAMDNHDALYVFILSHRFQHYHWENVVCIFHGINRGNSGTSTEQERDSVKERDSQTNERTRLKRNKKKFLFFFCALSKQPDYQIYSVCTDFVEHRNGFSASKFIRVPTFPFYLLINLTNN